MNIVELRRDRARKRRRDRAKRDEKVLRMLDVVKMTRHASQRAHERGVPTENIRRAFRSKQVTRLSARVYKVADARTVVVFSSDGDVITVWALGAVRQKKQQRHAKALFWDKYNRHTTKKTK